MARVTQVDTVSNNLANANTDGFKKDEPTFREFVGALEAPAQPQEIPRGPITNKDLHPLDGRDKSYVVVSGVHTDFGNGQQRRTNSALDVALEGPAFFEVWTPGGVRYTRAGAFRSNVDGQLVTSEGYFVLGRAQEGFDQGRALAQAQELEPGQLPPEIQGRVLTVAPIEKVLNISLSGQIFDGDNEIGQLGMVEFANTDYLKKQGGLLFENSDAELNPATVAQRTQVKQAMLETSNVNPVAEMAKLISAHRLFEHDMKAIQTYDQLMNKESNDLGKL
jgi:flagellar basal-body rod protein FlgF